MFWLLHIKNTVKSFPKEKRNWLVKKNTRDMRESLNKYGFKVKRGEDGINEKSSFDMISFWKRGE